jgi:hypothetical protein
MTGCSLASPHLVDLSVSATLGSQSSGKTNAPLCEARRFLLDEWGSPCSLNSAAAEGGPLE